MQKEPDSRKMHREKFELQDSLFSLSLCLYPSNYLYHIQVAKYSIDTGFDFHLEASLYLEQVSD